MTPEIRWNALCLLETKVLEAAPGKVYFVWADPARMERAEATYDVASGTIVKTLCMNRQSENFDTYPGWVWQNETDRGRLLLEASTVLMFGSHWPNWAVDYLQNHGLLPVDWISDWSAGEFKMVDHNTSQVLATVNYNTVDLDHEDYFVLMACIDENLNLCFVSYGFDWKGTWAAGKQLQAMIDEGINFYTDQYYVYHWTDTDNDGIPEPDEFTLIT